jgi:hypothetical protein
MAARSFTWSVHKYKTSRQPPKQIFCKQLYFDPTKWNERNWGHLTLTLPRTHTHIQTVLTPLPLVFLFMTGAGCILGNMSSVVLIFYDMYPYILLVQSKYICCSDALKMSCLVNKNWWQIMAWTAFYEPIREVEIVNNVVKDK